MPIFKISAALKKADRDIDDPTARCIDCEYPTEKNNPLMPLGETTDGSRKLFGHENCSSYRDKLNEEKELQSREQNGAFAFASKFRTMPNVDVENSTVEETFPVINQSQGNKPMTETQVDANYEDGAPVPPKH